MMIQHVTFPAISMPPMGRGFTSHTQHPIETLFQSQRSVLLSISAMIFTHGKICTLFSAMALILSAANAQTDLHGYEESGNYPSTASQCADTDALLNRLHGSRCIRRGTDAALRLLQRCKISVKIDGGGRLSQLADPCVLLRHELQG